MSASRTQPSPRLWILLTAIAAVTAWWLAARRETAGEAASGPRAVDASAQRAASQAHDGPQPSTPALVDGEASCA